MLQRARHRLGDRGEYILANLLDLPFDDSAFDCAISLHTIYHIDKEDQEGAVRELLRVTKSG